jgi:carbonic anhydrase
MRNMSGRIKPALSDIASLDSVFHLGQVVIMHHSNCGSTHGSIDQMRTDLKSNCPDLSPQEIDSVLRESTLRTDDDGCLKDDLETLRECKFIRRDLAEEAVGLWLDVDTGLVRQVKASDGAHKV